MQEFPHFELIASTRSELPKYTRVVTNSDIAEIAFVKVPREISKSEQIELIAIDEVSVDRDIHRTNDLRPVDINICSHTPLSIWYELNTAMLNFNPGYHVYRLTFENNIAKSKIYLYIGYVVSKQPEQKPYKYMKGVNE